MTEAVEPAIDPEDQLHELLSHGSAEQVATFLRMLAPEETSYTIAHLSSDDCTRMLQLLVRENAELAADLMEHFVDEHVADMVGELEPAQAAVIVDEMDSDEQADVLAELPEETAEAILDRMSPEEADDARARLAYAEDTAGGLMITEMLVYHPDQDIDSVLADLREHADERGGEWETRYLYVTDNDGRLAGVVNMRTFATARRAIPIARLAIDDPTSVHVHDHIDDLEHLFDRVNYSAVPVLDDDGRLVGVVQRAAVQEALSDAAGEDLAKFGGIIGGEELRSMGLLTRFGRRATFLFPVMLLMMVSASIIALYEGTVEQVPILAAFLPVVAGLCGSAGSQAMAVTIREISLGLIKPTDLLAVLGKEIGLGMINGIVLGVILAVLVTLWKRDVWLGVTIGGALPVVMSVAACIGGCVPLVLTKLRVDPAMLSGPVVTTVVDLLGFFVVLTLASLLLISAL